MQCITAFNILMQQGERIKMLFQSTSVNFSEHFLMPNTTMEVKVVKQFYILLIYFGVTNV